jgi:hypothetical protein
MTYQAPEIFTLGAVEELTLGGDLHPSPFDFFTGYNGFIRVPVRTDDAPVEAEDGE